MKRFIPVILFLCFLSASIYGGFKAFAGIDVEENPTSITILASSSLTDVMTELTRIYSTKSGYSVAIVLGSPAELVDSIEDGESADFFISEDQAGMTNLKQKGLVDVFTISNLAQNRLVLAASVKHYLSRYVKENMALERLFSDLNERVLLVMGDPDEVPVGERAKEAITNLGHWKGIEPFIVREGSARKARYLIAKGRSAGITYYTDSFGNPEIKILTEFPEELYSPIIYQGAVVAGLNMPVAREFLEFMKSPEAKAVFSKYGFVVN
jgi:molybdate transport system substrate-binding protein